MDLRRTSRPRRPPAATRRLPTQPLLPLPSWSWASCRLRASGRCRPAFHCGPSRCQLSLSPAVRTICEPFVTRLSCAGASETPIDRNGSSGNATRPLLLANSSTRRPTSSGISRSSATFPPTWAIRRHLNRPISHLSAEPCNRLRRVTRARFDQRSECTTIAEKGTHLFGRLLLGVYLPSHRCASWPSSFSCFFFGRTLSSLAWSSLAWWREASPSSSPT